MTGTSGLRGYRLLAVLPAAALIAAPWVANRTEPRVAGMPFLLAWIVGGILLTSVAMGVIAWLDGTGDHGSADRR